MREIKFRAWEPVNKKMHILQLGLRTQEGHFVLPVGQQNINGCFSTMNLDAVELMQYTGIKDRNDKDIYEGDIVRDTFVGEEYISVVVFTTDTKPTIFGSGFAGHRGAHREGLSPRVEVIGNIHENPECFEIERI